MIPKIQDPKDIINIFVSSNTSASTYPTGKYSNQLLNIPRNYDDLFLNTYNTANTPPSKYRVKELKSLVNDVFTFDPTYEKTTTSVTNGVKPAEKLGASLTTVAEEKIKLAAGITDREWDTSKEIAKTNFTDKIADLEKQISLLQKQISDVANSNRNLLDQLYLRRNDQNHVSFLNVEQKLSSFVNLIRTYPNELVNTSIPEYLSLILRLVMEMDLVGGSRYWNREVNVRNLRNILEDGSDLQLGKFEKKLVTQVLPSFISQLELESELEFNGSDLQVTVAITKEKNIISETSTSVDISSLL